MATGLAASLSATPGGINLAQLEADVLSWTTSSQGDPELQANARRGINQAIHKFNTRSWRTLLKTQDITLVVGTSSYEMNGDLRRVRTMFRLNSSSQIDGILGFKESKTLNQEHPSATTNGTPRYYTAFYHTRYLELDKPPAQDFVDKYPTLRAQYHFRHPRMVNGSDVLSLPSEFELFVVWHARAFVAGISDPGKKREADIEWRSQWNDLVADDNDDSSDWSE